jgi:two-component sensor histidine kinase
VSLSSSRTEDLRAGASRDAIALDAHLAIARMLAAEADLEAILDLVARRGRALSSARAVVVELKEGGEMVVAAVAGEISKGLIGRRGGAMPSLAVEARLVVPLTLRGRSYGALVALGPAFSIEDEETLEVLAASAAAAVVSGKLRALIAELRPPVLDELGVAAAIEALADQVESPAVEVQTRLELGFQGGRVEARREEELKTAVYRIVQEALDNAIRHARATCVAIDVVDEGAEVRIAVRDDGRGFDPAATSSGFGLRRMRERAELFGGSLEIASAAGRGTEVRAAIPASVRATALPRPFRV